MVNHCTYTFKIFGKPLFVFNFQVGELPGYQDDTSDDGEHSDNELDQTADSKLPKMTQIKSTKEKNVHTMSDSDDGSDSHSSSDNLKNEPANNSQDILNMSPTLL